MKKLIILVIALFILASVAGCNLRSNVDDYNGLDGDRNNDGIVDDDILRNGNDGDDVVRNNRTTNNGTITNRTTTGTQRRPANG
jgi:hypothetical protein